MKIPPLARWVALAGIAAVGGWLAYSTTSGTRPPTIDEVMAKAGPDARLIAAGAFAVEGTPTRCGDAVTVLDPRLDDVAAVFPGIIMLNEPAFNKLPKVVRLYAYQHECAHITGSGADETAADCAAIAVGKAAGWLDPAGVEAICAFWKPYVGDNTHLPGPERCKAMQVCYAGKP